MSKVTLYIIRGVVSEQKMLEYAARERQKGHDVTVHYHRQHENCVHKCKGAEA